MNKQQELAEKALAMRRAAEEADELYLPGVKVDRRYDISSMTRHRWRKDPKLNFPQPVYINGRPYWRLSELVTWERAQAARGRAA